MWPSSARNSDSRFALILTLAVSALLLAPKCLRASPQISLAHAARRSKAKPSSTASTPATSADATGACAAAPTGQSDASVNCASDRAPLTEIDATFDASTLTPADVKSLLASAQNWQIDKPDKQATRGLDKWAVKEMRQALKACNTAAKLVSCNDVASKLRTPDPDFNSFDFTVPQAHYQVYQALFRACAIANMQGADDGTTCGDLVQAIGSPSENIAAALAVADDSSSCKASVQQNDPDPCVTWAFFSVPGTYHGYYELPAKIQKVGEDVCQRTGRGCSSLTAWKAVQAAPAEMASAGSQDDSSAQPNAQEIQDKIDTLNQDIESLESEKQNDEQLAEQDADFSNCGPVGYGTFGAIGAAGCRTADEIAEAKAREAVNQDANKIDDDRAEIARLQGEEVEERPHRDASFAGALNQVSQENGQTSIQATANQQAANMLALGAANDAARRAAAEQAAAQLQAQQAAAQQQQQASSSASSEATTAGPEVCPSSQNYPDGGANCNPVRNMASCIRVDSAQFRSDGNGSSLGEVDVAVTNTCSATIELEMWGSGNEGPSAELTTHLTAGAQYNWVNMHANNDYHFTADDGWDCTLSINPERPGCAERPVKTNAP